MPKLKSSRGCIDQTLREVVWQAVEQGRITCGVQKCVLQLESEPCDLLLCVLPPEIPGNLDISTSIQHTLIEAFCLEHSVQLVKVDDACKLDHILQGRSYPVFDEKLLPLEKRSDLGCVIVRYPNGDGSKEDRALAEYCKSDTLQYHHIALPD